MVDELSVTEDFAHSEEVLQEENIKPPFNIVSIKKFWILTILSLGIYQFVWFYTNLKANNSYYGTKYWAFIRSCFPVFFILGFIDRIDKYSKENNAPVWNSLIVKIVLFILVLVNTIRINQGYTFSINISFTSLFSNSYYSLVSLGIILGFNYLQNKINIAADDPKGKSNDKLVKINYIWLGVLYLIMGIIALIGYILYWLYYNS